MYAASPAQTVESQAALRKLTVPMWDSHIPEMAQIPPPSNAYFRNHHLSHFD
jgi:hypothetical protein